MLYRNPKSIVFQNAYVIMDYAKFGRTHDATHRHLKTVLPVFFLLLIGLASRRWRILTQDGIDGLKSIVIKVMLPILQFRAFLQVRIGANMLLITLGVFLVCMLGLFLGRPSGRLFRNAAQYERYLFASFEVGMLGYALYIFLFGNEQIANFATVAFG